MLIGIKIIDKNFINNKHAYKNRFKTGEFLQMCTLAFYFCDIGIEADYGVMKTKQKRTCHHDVTGHRADTDILIPFVLNHGSPNILESIEILRASSAVAQPIEKKHICVRMT